MHNHDNDCLHKTPPKSPKETNWNQYVATEHKIDVKNQLYLYTLKINNYWKLKQYPFIIGSKNIKYLGIKYPPKKVFKICVLKTTKYS